MQATVYANLTTRRLTTTLGGSAVSFPAFVQGDKEFFLVENFPKAAVGMLEGMGDQPHPHYPIFNLQSPLTRGQGSGAGVRDQADSSRLLFCRPLPTAHRPPPTDPRSPIPDPRSPITDHLISPPHLRHDFPFLPHAHHERRVVAHLDFE